MFRWLLIVVICLSPLSRAELLKVAVPKEGYPPYIIVKNKNVAGVMIEVLNTACHQLGLSVQYQFYPEVRSKLLLDQGVVHGRMEAPAWSDNPKRYHWTQGIVNIEDLFVYRSDASHQFDSLDDVQDATIITHLGYYYPTLDPLFQSDRAKRQDYPSEVAMLNGLMSAKAGHSTVAIMDRHVTEWLIRHNIKYTAQFSYSSFEVDNTPLHFQFARSEFTDLWVPKINEQIQMLLDSGAVEEAMERSMAD